VDLDSTPDYAIKKKVWAYFLKGGTLKSDSFVAMGEIGNKSLVII
jgi:hypothetical protein